MDNSIKEDRIRAIALSYYSRQDIRKNMLKFAKNREVVPRYFEGFGKRPDTFHFDSDILELAKKGATSFHGSEEIWEDPLEINTGMSEKELNEIREGWDLLIDIDSKYFDYSKIFAEVLVDVLRKHGVKNFRLKFSGSKGWHLIVPWKAFPKKLSDKNTKDMFPEWPRLICKYLSEKVSYELKERVLDLNIGENQEQREKHLETYCVKCNGTAVKTKKVYLKCPNCRSSSETTEETIKRKRKLRCPSCLKEMNIEKKEPLCLCRNCGINSDTNSEKFKERVKTQDIDADIILVSPRHLFRMPYSLHEKTSLASVVVHPDKIKNFNLKDAHPLKIGTPEDFLPECEEGEATNLLVKAIENQPLKPVTEINTISEFKPSKKTGKDFQKIKIPKVTEDLYPPVIKIILKGMKNDGRKRALFILLSYLRSMEIEQKEIDKIVQKWNEKNAEPLKLGYIKSQLNWYAKKEPKLPPNYDKPYYKEIGIQPTNSEIKAKNPVSYSVRVFLGKSYDRK